MTYKVIQQYGEKWLRAINPFDENGQAWRGFKSSNPDLPYIGSRPEGTTVDESEVREVRQHRHKCDPKDAFFTLNDNTLWLWENRSDHRDIEFRTAYTDAESHDRQISDNPRYPLFSHMSDEHGLTLLDSELDEIARHAAPLTGVDYWKERCKVAESLMGKDLSEDEYAKIYDEWEQLIEQNQWPR